MSGVPPSPNNSMQTDDSPIENDMMKARVLYDYDAKDSTELSLIANEVILIKDISDEDYVMGKRGNQKGKVPKPYLELLT